MYGMQGYNTRLQLPSRSSHRVYEQREQRALFGSESGNGFRSDNMLETSGRYTLSRRDNHVKLPTKITPLDTASSVSWGTELLGIFENIECPHFYDGTHVPVLKASYSETRIGSGWTAMTKSLTPPLPAHTIKTKKSRVRSWKITTPSSYPMPECIRT
jgi:hypothetical protein